MDNKNVLGLILSGLGTNILVVALSAILPLLVGIGLTMLMHVTRKSPLPKVFRYVAILTEGLVPTAVLFITFFSVPHMVQELIPTFRGQPIPCAVIGLSICFLGYMAFRYDERDSLLKNIVVNGIGLIADLFKWCVALVAIIGVQDLIGFAKVYVGRTYEYVTPYTLVLVVSAVVLVALYFARQLCKDLMK